MAKATGKVQSKNAPNNKVTTEKHGNSWIGDLTYPIRDVLLAALGKGQFILAALFVLIGMFLWRCPNETLPSTFNNVLTRFGDHYLTGWILFFLALLAWFFHYRYLKNIFDKELKRVEDSKSELQTQIFEHLNKKK